MSKDYESLGFKAGLEIHQQLEGRKLFCDCPTLIREDEPDFMVTRQLRASVGESGEVDVAASHEQAKQKQFVYQGYQDTTCLVEVDEEPVSAPNPLAVETAVMVSDMLSMKRFDKVHVMRKVVVDGSNTSGFQRTMSVSSDGIINDVRVDRLCLEEDSCKVISRGQDRDVYNLSRLGIPLLEITTKPDIRNPDHLQEIASEIGMVLRSTGRVKRGLGTIRQDVNISIAKGTRVEIKGVQDLDTMPLLAENEVSRQEGLVEIANKYDSFTITSPHNVSDAFKSATDWIQKALSKDSQAVAGVITEVTGLLGTELFEDFRVGTELSGYAKAWGFGGLIHTDEDASKYGLSSWDEVRKLAKATKKDTVVILIGDANRAEYAINHPIKDRIQYLAQGVPSCVRKANADATTTYLRPMPGSARMYPETDVYPLDIINIGVEVPELLSEMIPRLAEQYSLDEGVVSVLVKADRIDLFESWADKLDVSLVSEVLASKQKELRKRHDVDVDIDGVAEELFEKLVSGDISKSAIDDVLLMYAKKGSVDWSSFETISEDEVREVVKQVIASDPDAPMGALMGAAMSRLKGKADGKLVNKLLQEQLK